MIFNVDLDKAILLSIIDEVCLRLISCQLSCLDWLIVFAPSEAAESLPESLDARLVVESVFTPADLSPHCNDREHYEAHK